MNREQRRAARARPRESFDRMTGTLLTFGPTLGPAVGRDLADDLMAMLADWADRRLPPILEMGADRDEVNAALARVLRLAADRFDPA